jgi:hypothetical protein
MQQSCKIEACIFSFFIGYCNSARKGKAFYSPILISFNFLLPAFRKPKIGALKRHMADGLSEGTKVLRHKQEGFSEEDLFHSTLNSVVLQTPGQGLNKSSSAKSEKFTIIS